MKKIVLSGLVFAMLLGPIYSCQKEVKLKSETSVSQLNSNKSLSDLTDDFIMQQRKLQNTKVSPFWRRVIGADLTGAGVGALAGMGVGAAAAGIGAVAGGIVGGLFGGAGASFTEAGGLVAPENTGGIDIVNNANNPYDFVGVMHYDIMRTCQADTAYYLLQNGTINMSTYKTTVFGIAAAEYKDIEDYMENFSNDEFKGIIYDLPTITDISDFFVSTNSSVSAFSSRALSILNTYSDALDETTSPDEFIAYSIQAEAIVLADTVLNDKEKAFILGYMSTARIALGYYM